MGEIKPRTLDDVGSNAFNHLRYKSLALLLLLLFFCTKGNHNLNCTLFASLSPCLIIRLKIDVPLNVQVATFIIERILISDQGMKYCITFADRFYVITQVLSRMLDKLPEEPSHRLLKLIIHCFLRLSDGLTSVIKLFLRVQRYWHYFHLFDYKQVWCLKFSQRGRWQLKPMSP